MFGRQNRDKKMAGLKDRPRNKAKGDGYSTTIVRFVSLTLSTGTFT